MGSLRRKWRKNDPSYLSIAFQFAIALSLAYLLISDTKMKHFSHQSTEKSITVAGTRGRHRSLGTRELLTSWKESSKNMDTRRRRTTTKSERSFHKGRLEHDFRASSRKDTTDSNTPYHSVKDQAVSPFDKPEENATLSKKLNFSPTEQGNPGFMKKSPNDDEYIEEDEEKAALSNDAKSRRTRQETPGFEKDNSDDGEDIRKDKERAPSSNKSKSSSTEQRKPGFMRGSFDDEDIEQDLDYISDTDRAHDRLSHKFDGVQVSPINDDNITRISFMLYRVIKAHNIGSMIDIPCTKSVKWMPELLYYLDLEIPQFRYICVVPSKKEEMQVKKKFGVQGSPEFIAARELWDFEAPRTDLAFVLNAISYMNPIRVWVMFKCLRKAGTKYVILGNHQGIANRRNFNFQVPKINVRKQPFHFNEPLRVISNVSINKESNKQMFLYEMHKIRKGL